MKGYNGLYLVGNYPDRKRFIETACRGLKTFDFLEVGLPFSDPAADGPVITRAAGEALRAGATLAGILESVKEIRKRSGNAKKIYIMTYVNPVFSRGTGKFARLCRAAGIDGVIIPDVPYVESGPFVKSFTAVGMEYVHFLTPESTVEQALEIAAASRGFIYFISMRGITGGEFRIDRETRKMIRLARSHSSSPVVLGFGIRSGAHAREALRYADGFIIGTKIIELLDSGDDGALEGFFQELEDIRQGE